MGPMQDIRAPGSFTDTMQSDPEFWALRINAAWRRSLESVIETGRLLIDAKARLTKHGQWENMVEAQLDFSPSTAQRLMIVARDQRLSNPAHAQLLPRSLYTLYELTKLDDAQFSYGIEQKVIRPDMERKDVEIIRPTPQRERSPERDMHDAYTSTGSGGPGSGVENNPPPHASSSQEGLATPGSSQERQSGNVAKPDETSDSASGESPGPSDAIMPGGGLAIAHNRVEPTDSLDFFPTPPWATRALFERVLPHLKRDGRCKFQKARDPCCGAGHMSGVMREYFFEVLASDIGDYDHDYEKANFLEKTPLDDEAVDWFVMNSPFGPVAEDFCLKSIDLAGTGVAMLVRLQWLETPGRYERIYKNNPPSLVAIFSERVPLHKGRWVFNGKTMTAYVWLVWIKGMPPQPPFWIPPGCRAALTKPDDAKRFGAVWEDDDGNIYPSFDALKQATRNEAPPAEAAE